MSTTALPADDFALLHTGGRVLAERGRRTLWALAGMALLCVATALALAWYLQRFEHAEEQRRRSADAQWLEQSLLFHLRRLEADLAQRARQLVLGDLQALPPPGAAGNASAGLLWRTPGAITAQLWLANGGADRGDVAAWQHDLQAHPDNARALQALQDATTTLRRAGYAGPMRTAAGQADDRVWLAVPTFDGGRLAGLYLVALSLRTALDALLPPWFSATQNVRLQPDVDAPAAPAAATDGASYRTALNLPGTELLLELTPQGTAAASIPRVFFAVAMVFLLGMLAALAALWRDFAKRQQIEQRLQAEIALRSAMERSASIGMRAWDLAGTILYVNPAFCTMVGYAAHELRGLRAPLPYWPTEQSDEMALLHQNVLTQGTPPQGVQTQLQHRDGHRVDVLIHEAPLTGADGRQIGWMSSVLDISARKRAEERAQQQQEQLDASERLVAVGEVASTLAHELNQPLGALASFANGLLNRLRAGSITLTEMGPVVQRMAQLAERAGGVTQRVNAFARKRELHLVAVDLCALAERAAASAQEGRGPAIALAPPAAPLWVHGDALLLEHLVHNLCANALDWAGRAAPPAPARVRLRLTVDTAEGVARVSVADNGPGVASAALARLFDAFFSTKDGGMGMGLAICRSIAEAHHGRIEVGRDTELGGACFTAVLPLAPAPASP